jgi:hypothetical protein
MPYAQSQQGTIQLPATGQLTSYHTGDDGDLQMGVPIPANRFTDNGDGSISDTYTDLMWAKDGNLIASRDPSFDQDRTVGDGDIDWRTALDYIEKLNTENYLGHNDWRMPNCMELRSLLNLGNDSITFPADHPFINLKEGYWSSTTSDRLRGGAFEVYLSKYVVHANTTHPAGHWETMFKDLGPTSGYFVVYLLPVRSGGTNGNIEMPQSGQTLNYYNGDDGGLKEGTAWPSPRLVDNQDGSVTDRLTGLMWTANSDLMYSRDPEFDTCGQSNGSVYWKTALGYIEKLNTENYLGHNDWRLPNRNELTSLIDHSRHGTCLPENHPFFTPWLYEEGGDYFYWSSTTLAVNPDKAWVFHFGLSGLYSNDKNIERFVWPVRTDNSALPTGSVYGFIDGDDIPKNGVEITLTGPVNARTETDIDGYYEFANLPDGNFNVTPSYEYFAFTPQSRSVNVSGNEVSCNFMAAYTHAYGWKNISSVLYPLENASGAGLSYIYFINDDEGWIASEEGFYHTTDGGLTFETQTLPLEGDFSSAVFMFNENEGYVGSASGVIYHTTNGGDEWTIFGFTGQWVLDISFPPNSTTGFCSGANGSFWEISPDGVEQIVTGSDLDLRISTPSTGHTFIGASPHRLWHYDGNEIVDCCTMGGGTGGIHFHNDTLGWLSKSYGGIDGSGGIGTSNCIRLKPSHDTLQYHFTDVHSPNGKDVWVVGAPGVIWYSPNGNDFWSDSTGAREYWTVNTIWYQQAAGLTNDYLQAVFFTSPTNGYASGSNGTLLKYTLLEGAPEGADIIGFTVSEQEGSSVIDPENYTVYAEVDPEADLTSLIPELFLSAGATCDPSSGISQDFTSPVDYVVTSSDGGEQKTWTVSVSHFTGTPENRPDNNDGIVVYPNPTSSVFSLQSSVVSDQSTVVEVVDLYGKSIIKWKTEQGTRNKEHDIGHLPSGIYFIRINLENQTIVKKIIKL